MKSPDQVRSVREMLSPGQPVGVTEGLIHTLVYAFYDRVRADPDLGPVFDRVITDWTPHLAKMCDFWSSVTLMSGRYHGTPMSAHAAVPGIEPRHFTRWLELFRRTANDVCPPDAAALFVDRAERIAQSLQTGIAVSRGELPAMHQRLDGA